MANRGPKEFAELVNRFFTTKIAFRVTLVGAIAGFTVLVKDYAGGQQCTSKARMDGKTVIITGANTGIGKETAMDLAQRGAKVILACRDEKKAEKARVEIITDTGNRRVVARKLDLASLKSIRDFASEIDIEEENVHVLVNNAGIMRCPDWKTEDGFEMQFGVNHLGHFYLTNLLLDKIKLSAPSRIINLSSLAHHRGTINFDDLTMSEKYEKAQAYSNSKLANVLFTHELDKRLKGSGVTVNSVHPGIVKTELTRHMGISKSYFSAVFWAPINYIFLKTPKQGAQTTINCAINEKLEGVSGKYFKDCAIVDCNPKGSDDETAKKLWEVSSEMVGITKRTKDESGDDSEIVA